ncbi:Uncharacterised protein [uncultured archaeon]|nr:Uncharacterised protein [uncultured archaeon]
MNKHEKGYHAQETGCEYEHLSVPLIRLAAKVDIGERHAPAVAEIYYSDVRRRKPEP